MHGHECHNTTILSVIHNMSTACFGQYYFGHPQVGDDDGQEYWPKHVVGMLCITDDIVVL